jgi:hypothetical protein
MPRLPAFLRPLAVLTVALALPLAACERPDRQPTSAPSATAPAGETSPLISVPPDSLVWTKGNVTDARRQADIQDCYAFARARVRTGQQIDRDIAGTLNQPGSYDQDREFRDRLDDFEARNRQQNLFADCMASKGYVRGAPVESGQAQPAQ